MDWWISGIACFRVRTLLVFQFGVFSLFSKIFWGDLFWDCWQRQINAFQCKKGNTHKNQSRINLSTNVAFSIHCYFIFCTSTQRANSCIVFLTHNFLWYTGLPVITVILRLAFSTSTWSTPRGFFAHQIKLVFLSSSSAKLQTFSPCNSFAAALLLIFFAKPTFSFQCKKFFTHKSTTIER